MNARIVLVVLFLILVLALIIGFTLLYFSIITPEFLNKLAIILLIIIGAAVLLSGFGNRYKK